MKYNGEFSSIDDEYKAYVLGLIFADGCVVTNSNTVSICGLEKTHKELFLKICEIFPFFKYKIHSKDKKSIQVTCANKQLKIHMLDIGCFSRKSYENAYKLRLPILDISLYRHFIRGFFDGDGYYVKNKTIFKFSFGISGVNYLLLSDILKTLLNFEINLTLVGKSTKQLQLCQGIYSKQPMFTLYSSSFFQLKKFSEYIYNNSNIYLQYKKYIHDEIVGYSGYQHSVISNRPSIKCPCCGHPRCVYNGIRNNKQRMKCSKCRTGFTIKINNTAPIISNGNSGGDELLEG